MDLKTVLRDQWDRATSLACTGLGALLLLVGWLGVSDTPYLAEQAPYILSGGVGGVFLLGVAATLWISADLRDEWRKLDRIEAALVDGTLRFVDADRLVDLAAVPPSGRHLDHDDLDEPALQAGLPRRAPLVQQDELEAPARRPVSAARTSAARSETVAGTGKRGRVHA